MGSYVEISSVFSFCNIKPFCKKSHSANSKSFTNSSYNDSSHSNMIVAS